MQEENTPGAEEAVLWAEGYVIPPAVVAADESLLRSHGLDFEQLAKRRLMDNGDRLSEERVKGLSPDNLEI